MTEADTSRESRMVVIARDDSGKPTVWCDPEIADIVRALNTHSIQTVASCSGHGHRSGCIALADGRELIIAKDFAEARRVDAAFPTDINGERSAGGVDSIELNEDTIDILGSQNFACAAIARTLRKRGDDIPNQAENEQAATIAFLLGHYFAKGTGWRESATEELSRITSQHVSNAMRADGEGRSDV